jgi:hypothetical protein
VRRAQCDKCATAKNNVNKTRMPELFDDSNKIGSLIPPLSIIKGFIINAFDINVFSKALYLFMNKARIKEALLMMHIFYKDIETFELCNGQWLHLCTGYKYNENKVDCQLATIRSQGIQQLSFCDQCHNKVKKINNQCSQSTISHCLSSSHTNLSLLNKEQLKARLINVKQDKRIKIQCIERAIQRLNCDSDKVSMNTDNNKGFLNVIEKAFDQCTLDKTNSDNLKRSILKIMVEKEGSLNNANLDPAMNTKINTFTSEILSHMTNYSRVLKGTNKQVRFSSNVI